MEIAAVTLLFMAIYIGKDLDDIKQNEPAWFYWLAFVLCSGCVIGFTKIVM